MELLLLGAALTAITLAGVALLDVLTRRMRWQRKAGWSLLVIGLPVIGPLLYFLRAADGRRAGAAARAARESDRPPRRTGPP